jgi:hypothetical protein
MDRNPQRLALLALALGTWLSEGCATPFPSEGDAGFESDSSLVDSTTDGSSESSVALDATSDGASDAASDAVPDATSDAAPDATSDATSDAAPDAGPIACDGSARLLCGGTCTDVTSDPQNCGSCGSSCPGASRGETCSGGRCQPYAIASAGSPFALATDGINVYYLAAPSPSPSTTLSAVPVGGGTVNGPFAASGASTIATDTVDVYWGGTTSSADLGYISLAPVSSIGTASPVVTNFTDPVDLISADVADGYLKFAAGCDGIFSVPLRTPAAAQGGTGAGANGCVGSVAAANFDQIYWALPSSLTYYGTGPQHFTNSLTGLFATGETKPLSTASGIQGLFVLGSTIFYTDAAGGTVSHVAADGSTAPSAIALATSPLGLVVDSDNVYWIDTSGATIMRVPIGGGQAMAVGTEQSASAIAQDGSFVYWTNANAIMRVPK